MVLAGALPVTVDFPAIAEQAWQQAAAADPTLERRSFMAGFARGLQAAAELLELRETGVTLELPPKA